MEADHCCLKLWDEDIDIINEFYILALGLHVFPSEINIEYLSHQWQESIEKISQLEKFKDFNIMKQFDVYPR